jgi:hypothetical protein
MPFETQLTEQTEGESKKLCTHCCHAAIELNCILQIGAPASNQVVVSICSRQHSLVNVLQHPKQLPSSAILQILNKPGLAQLVCANADDGIPNQRTAPTIKNCSQRHNLTIFDSFSVDHLYAFDPARFDQKRKVTVCN